MPKLPTKTMESTNLRSSEKRKVGENNSLLPDDNGETIGQGRNKRLKTQAMTQSRPPNAIVDNGRDGTSILLCDDESGSLNTISDSMEERLLSTTVKLEDRRASTESESGGSTNSDKFYSEIKQKAEKTGTPKAVMPDHKPDVSKWVENNNGPSSLADNEESEDRSVNVFVRIVDPSSGKTIFDSKRTPIKTKLSTISEFLKTHNKEIVYNIGNKTANTREASLGSTISRPSTASTLNRPSSIMGEIVETSDSTLVNPVKVARRRKRGELGPILSSTHVMDPDEVEGDSGASNLVESQNRTPNTNGTTASSSYASTSSANSTYSSNTRGRRGDSLDHEKKVSKALGFATESAADNFKDPEFIKSVTLWGTIAPNQAVFARWRDRKYYSGKVTKKGSNDTWCVHFDDDMNDVASESHILPVKVLGIKNYALYCPQEKFKEELVIIVGQRSLKGQNDDGTEYACISDTDGRVIYCKRQNLSLQEMDARELRKEFQPPAMVTKAADLNVGNIVVEPRRRTGAKSPPPSSVIRKLVAGAFDASSTDPQFFIDATTPVVIKPTSTRTSRRPSTPSTKSEASPKPVETPENVVALMPALKSNDFEKTLLIKKEKKVFDGLRFLLTASGVGPPDGHFYDKEEYRLMIERNGGEVIDTVGKEEIIGKDIYLISDNYARTVKYIFALAAGYPCVDYKWIDCCVSEGRLLDYDPYRLASGLSITHNCVIKHHSLKPLKDLKIFVTSDSAELYNYWKPVLSVASAILLKKQKSKVRKVPVIPEGTEILITDSGCPKEVQDAAKVKGLTLVKPEWLVQAIITGEQPHYEGDDRFVVTQEEIDEEAARERQRALEREKDKEVES